MPIIDLHCDTIDRLYHDQTKLRDNSYHIDLTKLKKAGYLAQWFAIFIEASKEKESLMEKATKMYQYFLNELEENKEVIQFATNWSDYKDIKKQGKIAAFLSLEEGEIIERSIENLSYWISQGARMMTLTWNDENSLGFPHSMPQKGLKPFGKEVVSYVQNQPMLIDVSHLSMQGIKDVYEISRKPIIASHCDAIQMYSHTRNLSDEAIYLIAQSGGIIGINYYSHFLNGTCKSTIEDIIRHIKHIYQKGGEDILALGSDFDGISCELEVCDASKMDKLIGRLVREFPERLVEKLTYQNAERILQENFS